MTRFLICLAVLLLFPAHVALGLDHVLLQRDGKSHQLSGELVVEAQDGGMLVMDPQRVLWAVTPDELVRHEKDGQPFEPLDRDGMSEELLSELPGDFRVHTTAHYLICYNTTPAYARWCGALFERLYLAFRNYWRHRGLQLTDPDWPLVALIFDGKDSYSRYAKSELGEATSSIPGYYSLRTNRITTYDLTGADGLPGRRASSAAHVNRILSRPEAERTVATIIHEATHQLAFNCGMHNRYADIPLWVSEGIAIYFETPDLRSSRGWRSIGNVNRTRLSEFRRSLRNRQDGSLKKLLATDKPFRNQRMAAQNYAEAWALNYFLIRKRTKQYVAYLEMLAEKKPLIYDEPQERLEQFHEFFGEDLSALKAEFLRYMRSVR